MYDTIGLYNNTLAATIDGQVKRQMFNARARKFPSALEASLHNDSVPKEVYNSLIDAVHQSLPSFYEYVALRKRCLKLDVLDMYDQHVPIMQDFKMEVPYETACTWIREALKPLGAEYSAVINQALTSRWVDVWENKGKKSGAYSGGCYDSPPYILMNYTPDVHGAFTLAHELGHSVHTYLSNKAQPHIYSQYRIFVAEVASTVNEGLLLDYLLKTSKDTRLKAFLLNHKCDEFRTTVFRQTMFAEFERDMHAKAESGTPLTPKTLNDMYYELNKLYYGPDVAGDKRIALEWSRIPHFYYNFYVYKYATSFSVAEKIVATIGDPAAVQRYLTFLRSGKTKDPLELLTELGVDLRNPQVIVDALKNFAECTKALSALLS
jgi:oligoendopeptidase F